MTIFEYLLGDKIENLSIDEYGNAFYPYELLGNDWKVYLIRNYMDEWGEDYFLEKEKYEQICQYDIKILGGKDYEAWTRRPYYRLRGKTVTRQQAFDIIRRTDAFFCFNDIGKELIHTYHCNNWIINANHCPRGYGWVHVDGTIGLNGITGKYPKEVELVDEWLQLLRAFPFLDLVIAITEWNEIPDDCWDDWGKKERRNFELPEYDDEFFDAIEVGIYVHDTTIQFLSKEETIAKYKEYDALYGRDREKFNSNYYEKKGIYQVNQEYLKQCIEANGCDYDEALKKVRKNELRGIID